MNGKLRCVFIGQESLMIQCAEMALDRGHEIAAVVSSDRAIAAWAENRSLARYVGQLELVQAFSKGDVDVLFSIANLSIIRPEVLELAGDAVNFHDGPLPRYGGLNAPAWALMKGETEFGITWHRMSTKVDAGDILVQRMFQISPADTSLTLNTRCYEAAIDSFGEVLDGLADGSIEPAPQTLDRATYCPLAARPPRLGILDWSQPASRLDAQIRALDFGPYPNPLGSASVLVNGTSYVVRRAEPSEAAGEHGRLIAAGAEGLTVACGEAALTITELQQPDGDPAPLAAVISRHRLTPGMVLDTPDDATIRRLEGLAGESARHERRWVKELAGHEPVGVPYLSPGESTATRTVHRVELPTPARGASASQLALAGYCLWLSRLAGRDSFDLAMGDAGLSASTAGLERWFRQHVPFKVRLETGQELAQLPGEIWEAWRKVRARAPLPTDLAARYPALAETRQLSPAAWPMGCFIGDYVDDAELPGSAVTLVIDDVAGVAEWHVVEERLDPGAAALMISQWRHAVQLISEADSETIAQCNLVSGTESRLLAEEFNSTEVEIPISTAHDEIERQVLRTPERAAVTCRGSTLSYQELNRRANSLAHRLIELGAGPGTLVGLCIDRSLDMVVGMLGILKSGAAYVPLDPDYPKDRIGFMLEDSAAPLLVTAKRLDALLPDFSGTKVYLEPGVEILPAEVDRNPEGRVEPADLAYVIYTSGSTGTPKGVMVEHRNVVNFYVGMDQKVLADCDATDPGVWLAVTSLSFDISVLELLWTLARGFSVVVYSGGDREPAATAANARPISFSLAYFASDESENASDKYRLLLEGARFADSHGFEAVWTPERHFHAFGGLYPNPSVISAALAAITDRVALRAGSVVLPLHHPVRVAEEWSVVDNLSGGRVGIAFASGWQPDDFLLRPENYADAKRVLLSNIEIVRRLWRGEEVSFPGALGDEKNVKTLPRPVQQELPFWITTAGNPETFRQAGTAGANLLTHLLGQSVEELSEKLAGYREAWRRAGHPGRGHVTLMLHTFLGEDESEVRSLVREPLIGYLRSAASLIKNYAWSFPAFKRRPGQDMERIDLASLTDEEMEALLEHAFGRYYETSGLLGTPESCEEMVDRVRAIEVDEIACLIDFGVDSERVLQHLKYLDQLRAATSSPATGGQTDDESVGALIERYGVTHMQCTPSMARMLINDPAAREGMKSLDCLLIGGEAFPPALAGELRSLAKGMLLNMYGPTETTIWSAVHQVGRERRTVPIGKPIANTELHVVGPSGEQVPLGAVGELLIGGAGVVRGYHQRPGLTAERFVEREIAGRRRRLYRTGDLVRFRPDGTLLFLGRTDHQVKIRGYRIELGEIEAALERHPAVKNCVVVAREDSPGDQRLVGYLVPSGEGTADAAKLKEYLRGSLPDFMVPGILVTLEAFPLTPNAKVDRAALPPPEIVAQAPAAEFVAPSEGMEQVVARVWRDVLKVPRVGADDNFFDLGGHSLLAVEAHRRLRDEVAQALSITDIFRFPTVKTLAEYLGGTADNAAGRESLNRAEHRRAALKRRRARRS